MKNNIYSYPCISIGNIPRKSGNYKAVYKDKKLSLKVDLHNNEITIENKVIYFDYQKTGYGRKRLFICPYCGEFREKLYIANGIKCRRCANLKYPRAYLYDESGTDLVDYEICKITKELNFNESMNKIIETVLYSKGKIRKPKYMRWNKYYELVKLLKYLVMCRDQIILLKNDYFFKHYLNKKRLEKK